MSCCSYCCSAAVLWNVSEEMNENGSDEKQMCGKSNFIIIIIIAAKLY